MKSRYKGSSTLGLYLILPSFFFSFFDLANFLKFSVIIKPLRRQIVQEQKLRLEPHLIGIVVRLLID